MRLIVVTMLVAFLVALSGCSLGTTPAPPFSGVPTITPQPMNIPATQTATFAVAPSPTASATLIAAINVVTPTPRPNPTAAPLTATPLPTVAGVVGLQPPLLTATATSRPILVSPTARIFPTPNGPAITLDRLPSYPNAKLEPRLQTETSRYLSVALPPADVQPWMDQEWRRIGLTFMCLTPWPNWQGAGSFFWRDNYGNGYDFAIIPDARGSNPGGTSLIISNGATGGYRNCP